MTNFVLIGSYVGEGVSGSHRQERYLTKAFNKGFTCTLIKPSGYSTGIFHFRSLSNYKEWIKNNKNPVLQGSVSNSRYKKYFIHVKYFFFFDIINFSFFKTLFYLIKYNKINRENDFFLASSPGFSIALATYFYSLLNKKFEFSLDMRDAWATHPAIPYFKKIRSKIESLVFHKSCQILTISTYLKDEFKLNYNINSLVLYNVNLSIKNKDNLNFAKNRPNDNSSQIIKISYFGSLPTNFYRIEEFCKAVSYYYMTIGSKEIQFDFYGNCNSLVELLSSVKFRHIKKYFLFYDNVPHQEAIELMNTYDAVLFLGFDGIKNSGIVSTKIFEFFYLELRILAFDIRSGSDLEYLFKTICGKVEILNDYISFSNYLIEISSNLLLLPSCMNQNALKELDRQYDIFLESI